MRKLLLRHFLSPGDIVMLTAVVRDLHKTYPETFLTDVRTSYPQLWENNPHLTALSDDDPAVEVIDCHYDLINQSNQLPYHFLHGFRHFLNERLDLRIRATSFRGEIHLSAQEKSRASQVEEITSKNIHFGFWLQ